MTGAVFACSLYLPEPDPTGDGVRQVEGAWEAKLQEAHGDTQVLPRRCKARFRVRFGTPGLASGIVARR